MNVTILHGRNTVDIQERLTDLRSQGDPQGLNVSTHTIETSDLAEIRAALATPGFFGATRIVIISGMPGVDKSPRIEWDDLEPLLISQPDSTKTIIIAGQKIPANRKSLKSAKAHGWSVELFDLAYGQELVAWVRNRAEETGASLDVGACRLMLERLFPTAWQREDRWNPQTINMQLIATEIEKLAAAALDGQITSDLVEQLIHDRSGVTAFKLNDETFEGRTQSALVELDNVLANGEAPERIVGQIGYQPLVLFAAGFVQRYGPDTVAAASGISSGQLKATVGRKTSWRNRTGLERAAEALRRSEWLVKTGRASSSEVVLVPLIAEISEGFND